MLLIFSSFCFCVVPPFAKPSAGILSHFSWTHWTGCCTRLYSDQVEDECGFWGLSCEPFEAFVYCMRSLSLSISDSCSENVAANCPSHRDCNKCWTPQVIWGWDSLADICEEEKLLEESDSGEPRLLLGGSDCIMSNTCTAGAGMFSLRLLTLSLVSVRNCVCNIMVILEIRRQKRIKSICTSWVNSLKFWKIRHINNL